MKDPDLRAKAVQFLRVQSKTSQKPGYEFEYSAKQLSESIGGYAGSLGRIATLVVADLEAIGVKCRYERTKNPKRFVVTTGDA